MRRGLGRLTDVVTIKVRESIYGPVISDHIAIEGILKRVFNCFLQLILKTNFLGSNDRPISLRWLALDDEDRSLDAFVDTIRAKNWTSFVSGMSTLSNFDEFYIFSIKCALFD